MARSKKTNGNDVSDFEDRMQLELAQREADLADRLVNLENQANEVQTELNRVIAARKELSARKTA